MFRNIKLDLKTIAIIILGGALVLSIIFRRGKTIDIHENEIKLLHEQNETLLNNNDSLKLVNIRLDEEINRTMVIIKNTEAKLNATNNKIKRLEYEKKKITNHVNSLDADGISESLTKYLNRQ